ADAQTSEERFLRQIFVRDQMAEWSKNPLLMAKADGVLYWDVHGKRYLDALSGIYTVSVGHNNRRGIEAMRHQLHPLHFSPALPRTDARIQPGGRAPRQPDSRGGPRRSQHGEV